MDKNSITFFTIAYNDEKYISKTIESVLSQTHENIQYYIRDNGSTDSTYEIIRAYAERDNRIKVFHNHYNGDFEIYEPHHFTRPDSTYLTILDADDLVHPEYAQRLTELAILNNADMVVAGSSMFQDGRESIIVSENTPHDMVFKLGDAVDLNSISSFYGQMRPLWGKLYKTEFFYDKFATWFTKHPGKFLHAVDTVVSLSLLNQAETVIFCSDKLHYYRIKGQSKFTNHTPHFSRIFDLIEIYDLGMEMIQRMHADTSEGIKFIQSIARGHIKDIIDMMLGSNHDEMVHKKDFLSQMLQDERMIRVEAILGYAGILNQLEPLMLFIADGLDKQGTGSLGFSDFYCYARYKTKNIIFEKLLMMHLAFSTNHKNLFVENELYYWNKSMKIPKWYMKFCALEDALKCELLQNKTTLIQFIHAKGNGDDIEGLKNQILDWIDLGEIKTAELIIEQLILEQPLDFHLLYLRMYVAAMNENMPILNETWLLLKAYHEDEVDMMTEIEKIYRSCLCNH